MSSGNNITKPFEKVLDHLQKIKMNAQVFSEIPEIFEELKRVEKYTRIAITTSENYFSQYSYQIGLLSGLIDFQNRITQLSSMQDVSEYVFSFIKKYVPYEVAFIYLHKGLANIAERLITTEPSQESLIERFLSTDNIKKIDKLIHNRNLAILLSNVNEHSKGIVWDHLNIHSAIIFPLRLQNEPLGFGLIICKGKSFLLTHLSFINLVTGIITLTISQYLFQSESKKKIFGENNQEKIPDNIKYPQSLNKGPLFIFTLDNNGVIINSNSTGINVTDLYEKFTIGEKFVNLIPIDHKKPFQNILNQMKEDDVRFYKCLIRGSRDNIYMMEFFITKMELQSNFLVTLIFAVDTTQEYYKTNKKTRNQVLDEITRFSQIINGYLDNLLSVLLPQINSMKNRIKDEKWQRNFKVIQMSLNQTTNLVQKFMNFDSKDIEVLQNVNVNDLIREVIDEIKKKCPESIKLRFSLDPSVPTLMLYPNRFKQMLMIFSRNSVEALPGKGNITVTTKIINMEEGSLLRPHMFYLEKGKYIKIEFEDDGMGIDKRVLPQIFKPFFSTKIRNEGVGLGLYVAYNIIKDLGGDIFVESTPGERTVFYTFIPTKEELDMEDILPGMAEAIVEKTPTILVVDDEYNIRSMLKEVFEMNGFSVYTAGNGKEGVEIFKEHSDEIDLIILDMVMPVMDGKAAFYEIQKIKKKQKIIIISGYAQREDLKEILNKGALAFMSKPFQIDTIVAKVNECLSKIESK